LAHEPSKSINSSYQLRILLRRTSPHVWRRIVIPSHFTLTQLHQTIRLLFGWSNAHPCHFVIRGKSFAADPVAAGESVGPPPLSVFQFYVRERFLYDYRFELQTPVWRHEIQVEKTTSGQPDRRPFAVHRGSGQSTTTARRQPAGVSANAGTVHYWLPSASLSRTDRWGSL